MARFEVGTRVFVPEDRQPAPHTYYGRHGLITDMPLEAVPADGQGDHAVPFMVRFDGDHFDTTVELSWLEPE